ncbi:MAG: nucleotide-binding universal stress UspA family protein [Francisellaceae bacterium]|jgi:nucleotide-binding universal stress UspA family protein
MQVINLLVAMSLHGNYAKVLESAIELADKYKSNIILLLVQNAPIELSNMADNNDKVIETKIINRLNDAANQSQIRSAQVETVTSFAKNEISSYVKKNEVDLIAMGTHNNHGIALLGGSASNYVSHHVKCNIFLVHVD